jgi:3-oxoacyl-[acyl-carrier protein] reductase
MEQSGSGRLAGRSAVITGAGAGLGRAYALAFAREGAAVAVVDLDLGGAQTVTDEINRAGGQAIALQADVADAESVQAMGAAATETFGTITILVNNAALFRRVPMSRVAIDAIPVEEWDRMMAVNLRGPFLCTRACLPSMREQQYGKIINISSTRALRQSPSLSGGGAGLHYNTSKAGIIGFTRSLAVELGQFNICVNAIAPGATITYEVDESMRGGLERLAAQRAIHRSQVPEDLLGTALFLASADSDFMTGQTLVVDGGDVML